MLKINIVSVGKIKEKYIIEGINEYTKRLTKYIKVNFIEISEEIDNELSIDKESKKILDYLSKQKDYKILLDVKGKQIDSIELSKMIENITLNYSEISFVIGGSKGVNENVKNLCDFKLSISKMTFPHQLFKLILMEQIYRAISITNNIKYHK